MQDKETYPYGQVPRLIDGGSSILQSLAILRHVGRTHGLYGSSAADASRIDSLLDGLEDMRNKTRALVYGSGLSDEGFRHYVDTVLPPPPLPKASTRGSIMAIFVRSPPSPAPSLPQGPSSARVRWLQEKFAAELKGGYYCSSGISIADIALFNMIDCHVK